MANTVLDQRTFANQIAAENWLHVAIATKRWNDEVSWRGNDDGTVTVTWSREDGK